MYKLLFLTETEIPAKEPLPDWAFYSIIAGVIVVAVIIFLIFARVLNKKDNTNTRLFSRDVKGGDFIRKFYNVIASLPILSPVLRGLEDKLMPIYPSDENSQTKEMVRPIVRIIALSALAAVLFFFCGWALKPSLYTFIAASFVTYASSQLIAMIVIKTEQNKFKLEFSELISRIRYYFFASENINKSIEMAIGISPRLMRLHCADFEDILNSADIKVARRVYMGKRKDKYLKLFVSQMEIVKTCGNAKDEEGNSIFLSALDQMIQSLQEDRRRSIEKQYSFAFLGWVTIIPCLLQPYIQQWGMFTLSSLASFYVGRSGNVWKIVMLCMSFVFFEVIATFQQDEDSIRKTRLLNWFVKVPIVSHFVDVFHDPDSQKVHRIVETMRKSGDPNDYRTYYVKKILAALIIGISTLCFCTYGHSEAKKFLMTDVASLTDETPNANTTENAAIAETVPKYMSMCVEENVRPTVQELTPILRNEPGMFREEVAGSTAEVIVERLEQYDKEVFNFGDILIAAILALLAYLYPVLIFRLRRRVIADRTEDEIMQMQAIINMLRKLPKILPVQMLETLQEFAVVYKVPIAECVINYNTDSEAALKKLYYAEKNFEFRKIVEDFMRIKVVGVERAFDEVADQIKNHAENRKMEQKLAMEKTAKLAELLAMVPAIVIALGYMLAPFLLGTYKTFTEVTEMMQAMK